VTGADGFFPPRKAAGSASKFALQLFEQK
jgi:hypothetical protein